MFWPVEIWYLSEIVVFVRCLWLFLSRIGYWLFLLVGRVVGLLLMVCPLGLKARGVTNLFKRNSTTNTLGFKEFNINLPIQLDEVVDFALPELPYELMF